MRTRVMSKTTPTDYERLVEWHSICTFSCQTHYRHMKTAGGNQKNKNIEILRNLISVPTLRRACAIVMQLIFNLFRLHMSDAQITENIRPRNFLSPLFIFSVRRHRNHDDCERNMCAERHILNAQHSHAVCSYWHFVLVLAFVWSRNCRHTHRSSRTAAQFFVVSNFVFGTHSRLKN